MQYMLLLHSDPTGWVGMTEAARAESMQTYVAYTQALRAAGALVKGDQLHPAHTATTVTMTGGTRRVQDGPFAATKEQLGGYYIIEAPDLDAALDWAAKCPGAHHGTIEVRPIVQMP